MKGLPGYFSWDAKKHTLTVHCQIEGHVKCHVNRKCTQNDTGARWDQGRPVGFFLAWLAAATKRPGTYHDRDAHMKLASKESEFHPHLKFDVRVELRRIFQIEPDMKAFWDQKFERLPRDGEDDEPANVTY